MLGMAVWRLVSLLVVEDGPWYILAKMRSKLGVRLTEDGTPYGTTVLADAVSCVWCTSVWVAAGVWLAYLAWPKATLLVAAPLAISTFVIMIERLVGYGTS